ncbi:class I SAM-dependent methyltransferase [Streptomyces sp. NPDC057702]|uniref:class I SAM-dependent methyltransferase n=1 Tax=unclassified Streptomyces TaxID=2593676 RepID=UPI0036AC81B1
MARAGEPDLVAAVRDYYEQSAEREVERLARPADGAVEREVHARALAEHLPPAPARVLDDGGGPGTWTLWLAERGYRVTLADLSPALLDLARERLARAPRQHAENVAAVVEADARDLSAFPDGHFDALLCLGPLYHLPHSGDRRRALREARRVLRPGGVLFASVMPPYPRLLSTVLEHGSAAFTSGAVGRVLDEGRYDDPRPGRFTGGYLIRPEDVPPLFEEHGFRVRRLLASQGFLARAQPEAAALAQRDPGAYQRLLDLAYATADDPAIHGMAGHLLVIAERPSSEDQLT